MHRRDSRHRHWRSRKHHPMSSRILIIDFGSQFTQLIARRVREARVYSEIHPPSRSVDWIRDWKPTGIILSGGPNSVYGDNVPLADPAIFDIAPVLGICYGMQLIAHIEGGQVIRTNRREYGRAQMNVLEPKGLFAGFTVGEPVTTWMSHGDHIEEPPKGFRVTAQSNGNPISAFQHEKRPIYGVQFHPEVAHTPRGGEILSNFLFAICKAEPSWTAGAFIEEEVMRIRKTVGKSRVICGLSGGVDSSVAAALVHRAIGDQLTCIFVDTGLLRLHERAQVERTFRSHLGLKLVTVGADTRFLGALAGVEDPEQKRKIIGHTFIDVFEEAAVDVGDDVDFLVQGTLYPDVIESFSPRGGPPVSSVGVMGDERTYDYVLGLRAVTSTDGMTADWFPFPHDVLGRISSRIINQIKGINRVVYDVSSKPPATIEWE